MLAPSRHPCSRRALALVAAILAPGCADEPLPWPVRPDDPEVFPRAYTYVISALSIDQTMSGMAPNPMTYDQGAAGFNLDGRFSGPAGATPADCGHGDFFSTLDPDQNQGTCAEGAARGGSGCAGGIDNQLPEIANVVAHFGVNAREDLRARIAQGHLAIILRVSGVDGRPGPSFSDDSVWLDVYPVARPMFPDCAYVGTPGLTWAIDDASLTTPGDIERPRLRLPARIVQGRLTVVVAGAPAKAAFPLALMESPLYLGPNRATPILLQLEAPQFRFDIERERGSRGNLGGYVTRSQIAQEFTRGLLTDIPMATIETIFQSLVDLPSPSASDLSRPCEDALGGISIGLGFSAVRARLHPTTVRGPVPGACGSR